MNPIILTFLVVLFTYYIVTPIITKYRKWRKVAKIINTFKGDNYLPFIGTDLCLLRASRRNFWRVYLERNKRNGPVYRSWMGNIPFIHLTKAEHMEQVLNNVENVNKGTVYKFFKPWFGNGLLTTEKNKWRMHRKLLTPAFHFSILENFCEVFALKSRMLADQLLPMANGKFFDAFPYLTHYSLDVICETAMGVKVGAMDCADSEYVKSVYGVLEKIIERMFNPLYRNSTVYNMIDKGRIHQQYINTLHHFTEQVILQRQKTLEEIITTTEEDGLLGEKQKQSFLDLLLGINQNCKNFNLSFEDVRDEVDTFMFGGHDSSTVTGCWTLFLLGNNPEIQAKVHHELDEIFHGEDRPVTAQDLLKMQYLERVIKETLRIYTVVPAISRELSTEIDIDGQKIPPGVMVVLHFYELHRDEDYFPDPERFDPDRFLPENAKNRHPYSFLPFSAGPRNCIGQKFAMRSTKTLIATLMRRYSVKSLKKPDEVDCYFEVFLRPQDGMQLSLQLRNTM